MNHALAREIYGAIPWHIDSVSYSVLKNILADARNKVYDSEVKNNTPYLVSNKGTKMVLHPSQLHKSTEDFNGIGVIRIDGAITNSGGSSSFGMLELSSIMRQMASDSRVKGFVILADSGGGSSVAVETIGDTITEIRKTKPVYGLLEKGGTAASAMYMILSYCNAIYAQSEMSIVGSHGTMIMFQGIPANKEVDGVKHIRLYATKSIKKNEGFEEAINNDNYEVMISELLDPMNNRAIERTLQNRPLLQGTNFDTGVEVFAKDGVGTFIDGFASLSDVVNMILNPIKGKDNNNSNLNNGNKMTKEELKSSHPQIYNEIYSEGVNAEKDRTGAWMAHLETDSEAVINGIESGHAISNTAREKFIVKATASNNLKGLASASPAAVTTTESLTETTKEEVSEVEKLGSSLMENFKNL